LPDRRSTEQRRNRLLRIYFSIVKPYLRHAKVGTRCGSGLPQFTPSIYPMPDNYNWQSIHLEKSWFFERVDTRSGCSESEQQQCQAWEERAAIWRSRAGSKQ
jgi:hypothetical protein